MHHFENGKHGYSFVRMLEEPKFLKPAWMLLRSHVHALGTGEFSWDSVNALGITESRHRRLLSLAFINAFLSNDPWICFWIVGRSWNRKLEVY